MKVKFDMTTAMKKTTAAVVFAFLSAAANAAVVSGNINQLVGGTTNIDYYDITLAANGFLEIDVLANESLTGSLPAHPLALHDRNGDGEITVMDTQMYLYKNGAQVATNDDGTGYTAPGTTSGWGDGTISSRDSYLLLNLTAGAYRLAFGAFQLTAAEAAAGVVSGVAVNGGNGGTLSRNQTHADYRLTIRAFDDYETDEAGNPLYGNPVGVQVSAVPVPAAAWLFGSALTGLGVISRRKRA